MPYDKNEFLDYIVKFAIKNNWDEENVPKQIRAFFTTWAFLFRIDVDTYNCDVALRRIYDTAGLDEVIDYDEFENFMVGLIV